VKENITLIDSRNEPIELLDTEILHNTCRTFTHSLSPFSLVDNDAALGGKIALQDLSG
jgi:hypothetical protein